MTRDRSTSTIRLPAGQAPCEPSQPCGMRGRCARYVAQIPRGVQPKDYSTDPDGGTALCAGFYLLQHVLAPAPRESRVRA